MSQVVYSGNGSTGGTVPVDSNTYVSGVSIVTVANNTGGLSISGEVFLYWNTEADGSGAIQTAGSTFTFTGDVTLYAQWGVTTGLSGGGTTTHYQFYYDPVLAGPGGPEPARTNQVIAACETTDFAWLQAQFAGVTITLTLPIPTYVTAVNNNGGSWSASWSTSPLLTLNPSQGAGSAFVRCLMMAEVSEMLMLSQHKGWGYSEGFGNEESCGEGLSLFLTTQFQIANGLTGIGLFNNGAPDAWLNTSLPASNPQSTEYDANGNFGPAGTHYGSRTDYINSIKGWAGNGPATGCSILFLYYLHHQLGFPIPAIIAAAPGLDSSGNPIGGQCLREVYSNLTGDTSDPFPYFASLLAAAYPPNQVSSIPGSNPGPNTDDPWPIGFLSFVGAKNTWGKDEINNIIGTNTVGTYTDGFNLALDGFSLNIVGATHPSIPTIAFGGVTAGLSATLPNILHQSSNPKVPQQIQFAYDVDFAKPLGTFPPSGETPVAVNSSINVLSKPFPAATEFFFLAGADPYFTNVVSANTSVPWLSEDLRVFSATPGASPASQYQYPVPKTTGAPQFIENSSGVGNFDFNGAYTYIQNLLVHLNKTYGDPNGKDPFDPTNNIIPQQSAEFTADSTVTPFSTIGGHKYNNYSFAIARVRMTGTQGSAGAATGVRVFFRLWGTQTADTAWDPSYTYLSDDPTGLNPHYPLAPSDDHTLPFFATSVQPNFASPTDPEFQTGGFTGTGSNNLTITVQQGDSQWSYFGCYLNVNDNVSVNGTAIPYAFPGGTHHCLVAQIAYPGAPIQTVGTSVPTPESGDQLAQRNLQVTTSDNPGPASAHRVPQTFEVKPSGAPPTYGPLAGRPDELMIDWGEVPPGSTARIYWPAVSSTEVIQLASWMYGVHPLTAADAYTIEVKTIKGVTYVPIPQGTGDWYAGLFTVDLPQTVRSGQEFDIVVRRIGKRPVRVSPAPPPPPPPQPVPQIASQTASKFASHRHSGGTIHYHASHPAAPAHVVPVESALVNTAAEYTPGWERYIVGSFQVKIPVSTGEAMLPAEETTLAILKARLEALPKTDRWYPVLLRYISQIAGRVDGLGGDANAIPPSLLGYIPGHPHPVHPPVGRPCEEELKEFTGKVCEVLFDCFGDFTGFVLDDCCERRTYQSRERQIGDLVLRALKERFTIVAVTGGKCGRNIRLVAKG
ncbi:MAG: InlB B-repeat-containing protein [Terracidiphilus sp.]|jgi:hypothetical protein